MLKGAANFHIGDKVFLLRVGDLIVIPPDVVHHIEVLGDQYALELDVFTPKRPEYGG
jgi:quercetin dioxygenase-like cupin family protein